MRKLHRRVLITATTFAAAIAASSLLRPGKEPDAYATAPPEMRLTVVDRCGDIVIDQRSGEPVIVAIRMEPPPLDRVVGAEDPTVEQLPLSEGTQHVVLYPADPRHVDAQTPNC